MFGLNRVNWERTEFSEVSYSLPHQHCPQLLKSLQQEINKTEHLKVTNQI